jgi:hypothetical protein
VDEPGFVPQGGIGGKRWLHGLMNLTTLVVIVAGVVG